MSKVITFSRVFPSYHPRKGEPTYFVEKILESLKLEKWDEERNFNPRLSLDFFDPKHHTIRAGHRFKEGDWFSPRVWSGKPYASKQIIIAPDIQVKKTWHFDKDLLSNSLYLNGLRVTWHQFMEISKNDGLMTQDLIEWFKKPFTGQIICWNDNIEY